ncbi:MAG: gluconate 2-dehydrogenase subunit 3 family protein [bacterium]|nr:gluconate 2-dehydrogenase subunit 3 family protein [bacterium]
MADQTSGIERRLFLVSGLFAASLSLVGARTAWATPAPAASALKVPQLRFLAALCDTIIPASDTPGALMAQVPAFIDRIAMRASDAAAIDALRSAIDGLERRFDTAAGQAFATADAALRHRVLTHMDAAAMAGRTDCRTPSTSADDADETTYRLLKAITVWGFYTSEIGGSQDLRFELVPGAYEADIALAADWRNYCNETVLGQ